LHARAGYAYAALEAGDGLARAYHFDQAGIATEAAAAYRQVGQQELERFACHKAQAALERALALLPPGPTVARVETALAPAQACETMGDYEYRAPALAEALRGVRYLEDSRRMILSDMQTIALELQQLPTRKRKR
jgi:hypothetical protein